MKKHHFSRIVFALSLSLISTASLAFTGKEVAEMTVTVCSGGTKVAESFTAKVRGELLKIFGEASANATLESATSSLGALFDQKEKDPHFSQNYKEYVACVIALIAPKLPGKMKIEPPGSLARPGDVILGTWREVGCASLLPESGKCSGENMYLGTFVVAKTNGGYTISARDQAKSKNIKNSIGIYNVKSDGTSWTFSSNVTGESVHEDVVGNFDLRRASENMFAGIISVDGGEVAITKWVRIQ